MTTGLNTASRKPRVLLATAREWLSGARLALALHSLGCEVDLLSPGGHPARLTEAVRCWTRYLPLRPFRSLERALSGGPLDAIIGCDELILQRMAQLAGKDDRFGRQLRDLMQRTGATPQTLALARSRMGLMQLAMEEGIAVPASLEVRSRSSVASAVEALGLPMVLKSDGSAGGQGVRIAQTLAAAEASWEALHRPPGLVRAVKRGLVDREWGHLRSWVRREAPDVCAQMYIRGGERTAMAVASGGRVVASVEFEVVEFAEVRGPSSVLRVIDAPEMRDAMRRIVGRMGLSGFCGFDFMIEPGSGRSLLIEMNIRPTQIAYLPLGEGRDLVAAYMRSVMGATDLAKRSAATQRDTVALFPQELCRDRSSHWLDDAFHDVPWEAPQLVEYALRHAGTALRPQDLQRTAEMARA